MKSFYDAITLDWIALSLVPGLGLGGFWRLIEYFRSPTAVLQATHQDVLRVEGIKERQIAGLFSGEDSRNRGEQEMVLLSALGGMAVCFADEAYPPLLQQLVDPPPVLYILGRSELLSTPCVAVVGSRTATSYGRRTAFNLGRSLAALSVTVVSGLALGIDAQSHAGALAAPGNTLAVLGCGLDVVYPQQNKALFAQIAARGALITEYPLGTRPEGFRFPARNRIIAGLSQGVIVVEAAKKSGSLITAQMALDCDREVFAVPGQVDSCKSEGTHWLLQQGAKLVQSVEDIVDELDISPPKNQMSAQLAEQQDNTSLEPDALALLQYIEPYPLTRDAVLEKSGFSPARLSELLLLLELDGLIEMLAGDQLRKISS